ncbi:MAG: DegV family protein [Clostridia bacterium]|nr:DegV family protein [Clostridia bacterium]
MHPSIILLAETGSDITAELAAKHNIYLVPMHVSMGDITLDDGTFPPEDLCDYFRRTGKTPTTSASTPYDFNRVFDQIHEQYPNHQILHLAYSAITTCSYQNALLASEKRPYVTSVDTKHVSVGQAAVVLAVANYLDEHPEATMLETAAAAREIAQKTQMCFVPNSLDFLRAGGRVSNAAAMVGNLLGLHPCIEILDGKLMAQKKYRGQLKKFVSRLLEEFDAKHPLDRKILYLIHSPELEEEVMRIAETTASQMGFEKIVWMGTGCVITSHSGPGAIGIVGYNA